MISSDPHPTIGLVCALMVKIIEECRVSLATIEQKLIVIEND
jgi:hypothetical protein